MIYMFFNRTASTILQNSQAAFRTPMPWRRIAPSVELLPVLMLAAVCHAVPAQVPTVEQLRQQIRVGEYAQATEGVAQLLSEDPANLDATLIKARLLEIHGRYDNAEQYLTDVAKTNDDHPKTLLAQARLKYFKGDLQSAERLVDAVLVRSEANTAARFLKGQVAEQQGRYPEATEAYAWFADLLKHKTLTSAEEMTWAGRALERWSILTRQQGQQSPYIRDNLLEAAYQKVDRSYWPAMVAMGYFALNKEQRPLAAKYFTAALKINPHCIDAHLGLAELLLDAWQFEQIEKELAAAEDINPHHPRLMAIRAELSLLLRRFSEARELAEELLAVNPTHARAMAVVIAALHAEFREPEAAALIDHIQQKPVELARVHYLVGKHQLVRRQYRSAEENLTRAIELADHLVEARNELGFLLMQDAREIEARDVLNAALEVTGGTRRTFNTRTYNTLQLLDRLAHFQNFPTEHFIIRIEPGIDTLLAPYLADYLEGIYPSVCAAFSHEPQSKTIIEVFSAHDQFSVRTVGMPEIWTNAICTGPLIALVSPRDRVHGRFNWAQVLRHEFTHVVTLSATNYRIPHWLTEALSVYQEHAQRPWDWVQLLAAATIEEKLFTLENIDWGFVRPQREVDRPLAYAQAHWMVEYIVGEYGYEKIPLILDRFRQGLSQQSVFEETLGVRMEDFDKAFLGWAQGQVRTWGFTRKKTRPLELLTTLAAQQNDNAELLAELSQAQFRAQSDKLAADSAAKALAIDPNHPAALRVSANLAAAKGEHEVAVQMLERLLAAKPDSIDARRGLGRLALKREDWTEAETHFEALKQICPTDPSSYQALAAIHLQQEDPEKALPELAAVVRTETEQTRVHRKLAAVHRQQGNLEQAIVYLNKAVEIDPFDGELHIDLADAYSQANQPDKLISELSVAWTLMPSDATIAARLALAYQHDGQNKRAIEMAKHAVALDPETPVKSILDN